VAAAPTLHGGLPPQACCRVQHLGGPTRMWSSIDTDQHTAHTSCTALGHLGDTRCTAVPLALVDNCAHTNRPRCCRSGRRRGWLSAWRSVPCRRRGMHASRWVAQLQVCRTVLQGWCHMGCTRAAGSRWCAAGRHQLAAGFWELLCISVNCLPAPAFTSLKAGAACVACCRNVPTCRPLRAAAPWPWRMHAQASLSDNCHPHTRTPPCLTTATHTPAHLPV
jgi:hypothetical protein